MTFRSEILQSDPSLEAVTGAHPIKKGHIGPSVVTVQHALITLGAELPISTAKTGKPDGIFGDETTAKTRGFQTQNGLVDDGKVGPNTLGALDAALMRLQVVATKIPNTIRIVGEPAPEGLPAWVTWSPPDYVAAVKAQLHNLLSRSRVARTVITNLKHQIAIKPGKHARDPDPYYRPIERTIWFTPGNFIEGDPLYATSKHFVGFSADATLLHEIVHAMRDTSGHRIADNETIDAIVHPPHLKNPKVRSHLFFGDRGEFNAIVITNTYRSEIEPQRSVSGMDRNILLLRKDHHIGHGHMALAAPDTFHLNPKVKHYLSMLYREQREVCDQIAAVDCPFNPLRGFKQLQSAPPPLRASVAPTMH